MPLVSVIIPTYNRSQLLKQAIASVRSQTFTDFEIWVVNDGSRDDTHDVVGAIDDPRLHYIYQENSGLAAARNAGIQQSQGAYVAFLDDDDWWFPTKLEVQINVFKEFPEVGLVTCGWRSYQDFEKIGTDQCPWLYWPQLDYSAWLYTCPTIPTAVVIRRDWLMQVGGFDEKLKIIEDWDLYLRLLSRGCDMKWAEEVLCAYRIHSSNMIRQVENIVPAYLIILDRFFSNNDLPKEIQDQKQKVYAKAYLRVAARYFGAGLIEQGNDSIEIANKFFPEFFQSGGTEVLNTFYGFLSDPMVVSNPVDYHRIVIENLPNNIINLQANTEKLLSITIFEIIHRSRDRHSRFYLFLSLLKLARWQPKVLHMISFWKGCLEASVGFHYFERIRARVKK